MNCHFPIPNVQSKLLYQPKNIILQPSREHATIEKLQLQNELLKRQLNSLMSTQNRTNNFLNRPAPNIQNTVLNSEDEAELSYRNKISKLKSRKSSKKSVNYNDTTPSSPRLCRQLDAYNLTYSNSKRLPFVPTPRKEDQGLKVMIIQQDKNGRYFRDRQSQQKYQNNRLSKTQNNHFMQLNQVQYGSNRYQNRSENCQGTSREREHRKTESYNQQDEQSRVIEIETARIFPRYHLQLANQSLKSNMNKNIVVNQQIVSRFSKTVPSNLSKEQKDNIMKQEIQCKQNIRPKLSSPRGNAYIDRIEAEQRGVKVNESLFSSSQDSYLSIEQQLAHKKSGRKLKYDIYMCDQIDP